MSKPPSNISLRELKKAIDSLEKAVQQPKNEFTRDATIQRFEYTFELSWKTAKKVLEGAGIKSLSPKSVIRDMGQQEWIQDIDLWMSFADQRNLTSHTYNEEIAEEVYQTSKQFLIESKALLKKFTAILKIK